MLSLPTSVRVYLARGATDMRKSIDGLAAVTKEVLEHEPMSGHLFVFCNRRRSDQDPLLGAVWFLVAAQATRARHVRLAAARGQ